MTDLSLLRDRTTPRMEAQTAKPAGIQAVAARAGVSIATVSRVLNGISTKAGVETSARVRQAAEELGYRPAHAGRALRMRQTRLVALLMPDIANAFYSAIARSIETTLRDRDHTMILCNTGEDPDLQDFYLREMQAYHVRGVALLGAVESDGLDQALASGLPIAFVNRKPPRGGGVFVGIDNRAAGLAVAEHFLAKGFQSCGVIHGPLHSSASRERFEGFMDRLREAGCAPLPAHILDGGLSLEGGYREAARMLAGSHRPRAIFCGNDLVAYGLFRRCRELGLSVPQDIAIFGFDDNPLNDWTAPWLSTIHIPYDAFGAAVTDALFRLWDGTGKAGPADPLPFSIKLRGSAE
ncbi:LacI family DNA-binding transcriptional regulator [Acidisoma cellulosilytica]|uniref:LacI family DNA-binding transcriptional regulator n=1 Tax=Acidisoma cellulosilyticum TaxID=2802395 RepID=A0A964E7C6_9PROT|nr:LacI family DNA-binding transcriptional regulator [Acidisoma cellulosilyticum]MCB8883863.1 LacI family DNA-binding transcriptional regulator [Acidisoma cellulosilyticum]